jgi:hypothetical protein
MTIPTNSRNNQRHRRLAGHGTLKLSGLSVDTAVLSTHHHHDQESIAIAEMRKVTTDYAKPIAPVSQFAYSLVLPTILK